MIKSIRTVEMKTIKTVKDNEKLAAEKGLGKLKILKKVEDDEKYKKTHKDI